MLTFNKGSEFYRYEHPLSDAIVDVEFSEAVEMLAKRRMIMLAVETDYSEELVRQMRADVVHKLPEINRAVIVNPQSNYKIRQGDALFIAAESEPTNL